MNDERCENDKRRSSFRSRRAPRIILHVHTVYMYNYYTIFIATNRLLAMYKYTCGLHVHICTLYTDTRSTVVRERHSDYRINADQSAARICCLQNVRIVHERHFDYKINARARTCSAMNGALIGEWLLAFPKLRSTVWQ